MMELKPFLVCLVSHPSNPNPDLNPNPNANPNPNQVWSPTNLKPFEMYMTTFYRALKTGELKEVCVCVCVRRG